MPERIEELMTTDVVSLAKDASLRQAAETMREDRAIGDVLVMEEDGSLCGIVTDRDIVVRGIAEGLQSDANLDDVCEHEVHTIGPRDAIAQAIDLMEDHAIRRLPVIDDGQLVGVVSLGDLAEHRDRESALGEISSAAPNN